MKFWKWLFALVGLDILLGVEIFNGSKGRIGLGWVLIFIIIFFPLWLVYKLIILLFKLILLPFKRT